MVFMALFRIYAIFAFSFLLAFVQLAKYASDQFYTIQQLSMAILYW